MLLNKIRLATLCGVSLVVLTSCLIPNSVNTKGKEANKASHPEFLVGIASPQRDGKRTISFSKGFPVVITNLSNRPLGVWREWCSWGYYNLTFEARTHDGRKVRLSRKQKSWTRNGPDYWMLAPEESVIRQIVLTSKEWKGIEDLQLKGATPLFLSVVMEVPTTDQSKEKGVWNGKVVSPERLYHLAQ